MDTIIGVDLTQDGSPVVAEIIASFMTESEKAKITYLMQKEHDLVYELELNQNNSLLLSLLAHAKDITNYDLSVDIPYNI